MDLGFRLQSNAIVLAWGLVALNLPELQIRYAWSLTAIALVLAPLDRLVYQLDRAPNVRLWARISQQVQLPEGCLLIAHAGLNHYYTFTHGLAPAINWLPEFPVAPDRLWRLAHGVDLPEIQALLPESRDGSQMRALNGPYILIREDLWELFLQRCDPQKRESLQDWFNPWQLRPQFLLEKNQS